MGEQDRWKEARSRLARSFTAIAVIGCPRHQSNVWPRGWQEHTKQCGLVRAGAMGGASGAAKSHMVCVADLKPVLHSRPASWEREGIHDEDQEWASITTSVQ